MNKLFKDNVVLVTGATRGIGKDVAIAFAQEGAIAIIIGRSAETAQQTKTEIISLGLKAESYVCDVTNLKNVQEIANKILDKFNRIDILVNNAGITKDNLLLRMSEDDWDEVMKVNLRGVFNCTKVISKVMLKAQKGRIINISSVIGIKGNMGQANYAASKAGIIGFTKSVALEFASRGITVNAVAPGYIQTEMTDKLNDNTRQQILKTIPLGRFGTAKDVAGVCTFLASSGADYITGQTFVVDGGLTI
ncbi:MAG: 3-oxoacyl-(Acyl-carrier-protein) reductase [candidate division CPR1 bacterium GW2011_GWA2_42_17]|uniref:3-oxoacyl-[acyl-carrier-protein] reductase n=1 Tax=candidate division CPR1 bacterium GW2011_GWA2_42_17 TaxID=1618341 RepID=A0A0G0Z4Z4_9BACT|nr:MAG: 3-oxoacyl-(Acyl-carrier-protein) reductase [candidate division CPR1 bacterium GW2011_GWA2_42_17]